MREAIRLIVEASIMCCTQIDSNKFSRFFSIPINKDKLDKFGEHDMYKQITTHLDILIICVNECNKRRGYQLEFRTQ